MIEPALADRFARLALDCVHRQYPTQIAHVLTEDADARPPRDLTPIFFGCYDWHSAVHAHWTLVRLLRTCPGGSFVEEARETLAVGLTEERAAAELDYLRGEGRGGFERPYGLAWLVTLFQELDEWDDPATGGWSDALRPLAEEAAGRLRDYFAMIPAPVRTGEHGQTAFSLGLALDAARSAGDPRAEELAKEVTRLFAADRDWPLRFEPSGTDFLSPGLAEADVMRRVLGPDEFGAWLAAFLPEIDLAPAVCPDPAEGKLAHLDGLNLSRAWMLEGIATGLAGDDPRRPRVVEMAAEHREAGLAAVSGEHYAGGHWLGTFAVYLLTGRGLS
ncbi:MAG: DUF2891 domain-containing protein [Planctomycetota bacterium]|jgi:hypothetical protein